MTAAEEWLALPHTRTWLELVQAGEVPAFMYSGRARGAERREERNQASCLGAAWAPWPSIDDWAATATCPTCHAGPGEPCVIKRRTSRSRSLEQRWHIARTRKNNHNRDVGNAPWPENRIPGRSYTSLERTAR